MNPGSVNVEDKHWWQPLPPSPIYTQQARRCLGRRNGKGLVASPYKNGCVFPYKADIKVSDREDKIYNQKAMFRT